MNFTRSSYARYRSHSPSLGRPASTCGAAEALERRVLLSDAIPVQPEFRVNLYTTSDQAKSSAAMDADGNFVVAWESFNQDGRDWGVFARRYGRTGAPLGDEFRVNTQTSGQQRFPSVAMEPDGDFVVAWDGGGPGDFAGIFAQRFNAIAEPQGGQFRVNTYTTNTQLHASVAIDADGDFVVTWDSYRQDADPGVGVYAQRFDASGVPQGGEFRVNTFTTDIQGYPSVAMAADGDFMIAWHSFNQDGFGTGVYAQRYDAGGVPRGVEFRVNTFTNGDQSHASIASDEAGNFVIAWKSGQDNGLHIFARRYGADGSALGDQFRVSTSHGIQHFPSIAMDDDGAFTVAWAGYPQEGSDYGIYAQQYNAAGAARGGELHVNAYTTGPQYYPAIAMDAEGDFVVTWESLLQDGSGYGVYAQRYAVVPAVTSSAFLFESSPHRLRFHFNHDVRDSLGTDDLIVQNLTKGQTIPSEQFALVYDSLSEVATFIYVGPGDGAIAGVLPDGRYRATLRASGIRTPQGASPAADHVFDFYFLNGDANRDGVVNLRDFNILAHHFGQTDTDFTRGDFTYDGATGLDDFVLLASRFGVGLPAAAQGVYANDQLDEEDDPSELIR
jgi:hypothetical protein